MGQTDWRGRGFIGHGNERLFGHGGGGYGAEEEGHLREYGDLVGGRFCEEGVGGVREGGVRWYRDVEAWLEARLGKGEARRKEGEGMEGRWILVKA